MSKGQVCLYACGGVCLCVYMSVCVCVKRVCIWKGVSVERVYLGACVCEGDVSRGVGVSG